MYPALQSFIVPDTQYTHWANAYSQSNQCHDYQSQMCANTQVYQNYHQSSYPISYQYPSYYHNTIAQPSVTKVQLQTVAQSNNCSTVPTNKPIKPPYSYAALICMAINSTSEKKSTLREILTYIETNYQYYRVNRRWHSTIRHDLTVNDCFVKWDPRPGQKACLWSVHPEYQDMFSSGSLRRRRYRFKQGSASWLKAKKQSVARRQRAQRIDVSPRTPNYPGRGNQSLSDSPDTSLEDFTDILASCDSLSQLNSPTIQYKNDTNQLEGIYSNIPTFDDCVEDLYNSFQTDYYNTS